MLSPPLFGTITTSPFFSLSFFNIVGPPKYHYAPPQLPNYPCDHASFRGYTTYFPHLFSWASLLVVKLPPLLRPSVSFFPYHLSTAHGKCNLFLPHPSVVRFFIFSSFSFSLFGLSPSAVKNRFCRLPGLIY